MKPETLYYIGISQSLFVALVLLTKKEKQGSDFILLAWLLTISFKMMILMISVEHGEFFDNQFSIGLIPLTFGPFLFLYTKYLLYRGSSLRLGIFSILFLSLFLLFFTSDCSKTTLTLTTTWCS